MPGPFRWRIGVTGRSRVHHQSARTISAAERTAETRRVNGGTVLFYVIAHDKEVIRRLVEFLQQTDFAGVIFTRPPMDGTFTFDKAQIERDGGPDVEMAFRWTNTKNQFGIPGMIDADWQR